MLRMARTVAQGDRAARTSCLAGGVALNCVANGRILREGPFERLWIQPAAGDAGGALGAALFVWHQHLEQPRSVTPGRRRAAGLAPRARPSPTTRSQAFLRSARRRLPPARERRTLLRSDRRSSSRTGRSSAGSRGGWSSARGPWARAASSATRASPKMQSLMNLKIKFRESFRPFAPSRAAASGCATTSSSTATQPLHAAGGAGADGTRRIADDRRSSASCPGSDQLNVAALRHPGRHARRLLGPRPDGERATRTRATTT